LFTVGSETSVFGDFSHKFEIHDCNHLHVVFNMSP
jgi:hypothetical protein